MKTGKLALILATTGLIATGGMFAWANEAAPEGDKPAKKQVEAGKGERGPRGEGFRGEGRGGGMVEKFMDELNLSDDQKAQLHKIREEAKAAREAFKAEHGDELKALQDEMKAAREAKDQAKMKEVGGKIRAIMEQGPSPMETMEKAKAVLTPEQQEQLKAKMDKFREERSKFDGEKRPGKDKKEGGEEAKPRKRLRPEPEPKP